MTLDIFSIRHREQGRIRNTDEVELESIRVGSAVLDTGTYDERLADSEPDDAPPAVRSRWQRTDLGNDTEAGAIRDEVVRRARLLKDLYPFEIRRNSLVYKAGLGNGFYEYCLGICFAPSLTAKPYVVLPRSFERIVAIILRSYMGSGANSMHVGFPRDKGEGTTFRAAMGKLSQRVNDYLDNKEVGTEWRWDPDPSYPKEPVFGGDGGIDFVVWKQPPDGRIGQLFLLGQCACGGDWFTKYDDVKLTRLDPWFRPLIHLKPPVKCFTTPFILSDGNLLDATKTAGWVFDRLRLTLLAAEARDPDFQKWMPGFSNLFKVSRWRPVAA